MDTKIVDKHLVLTLNSDEVFYLHDIIDNMSVNDIKHILTERECCDYSDAGPGFVEEREAVVDEIYEHLEEYMDAKQNAPEGEAW